jgi:tetratricopeptide (TPR) repeat protein
LNWRVLLTKRIFVYSSRPQQFGSGAAITLEKYEDALSIVDEGLKRQGSDDALLCNNKIFVLVALGRYEEPIPILDRCVKILSSDSAGPLGATAGMFALRVGETEEGVRRYREAISFFKRTENLTSVAIALAYFAKESARAGLPNAHAVFKEASEFSKDLKFVPEAKIVLAQAEVWLGATAQRNAAVSTKSEKV